MLLPPDLTVPPSNGLCHLDDIQPPNPLSLKTNRQF